MKIVFLNVWNGARKDELVDYIKDEAKDTDVFCFQEASDVMRHMCKDVLMDYVEISDYKFIEKDDDFAQSVFIKKGIEVAASGSLGALDMGVGLALYVHIKIGDMWAYICNVHGRARPSNKQDNPDRLRFSSGLIDFFKDKDGLVIIGGDFNLGLKTESVGMFKKRGYKDLINEYAIQTTRNHFVWDKYPDNKMYHSDYVFINNETRVKCFNVIDNEVSDHLPMILEIVEPALGGASSTS